MDIAALLSGGVDSSVVVHLLCEQGYKPTLFYIKIGMDGAEYMDCSAEEDIDLSTATARKYGLSLEVVDLHQEYWENVAAYAIDKIRQGLTPNPDVMCNKLIKFGRFFSAAISFVVFPNAISFRIFFSVCVSKWSSILDAASGEEVPESSRLLT